MDNLSFSIVVYAIIAMGLLSLAWIRGAMSKITDEHIKRLFKYLMFLTVVSILFAVWVIVSMTYAPGELSYRAITSISLVSIFAAISGAALSAKKISEVYGFNVPDKQKDGK